MEQKRKDIELLLECSNMKDRKMAQKKISERTSQLIEKTGWGFDLTDVNLKSISLSGFDLRKSIFEDTILSRADLSNCDLRGSLFNPGSYHRVNFTGSKLSCSILHSVVFHVCDFSDCKLNKLIDATYCVFHGCNMIESTWKASNLVSAVFQQCDLSRSNFKNACLTDSSFDSSNLQESTLKRIKAGGVKLCNCVLKNCDFRWAYLYNATIEGNAKNIMDLSGSNFTDAVLTRAKLFGNLKKSIFNSTLLINSRLDLCNFIDTQFKGAIISERTTTRKIEI